MTDVTGRTLSDRYEIKSLDHEELLGSVFDATDLDQGRRVSVKVLHPHLVEDREKFKRFAREITNTWMVSQENTVEVVDWGDDGDAHFLVLEHLFAHTLAAELANGPLPAGRVAAIAAQIARAIGAAHQEGIVHRALTPDNVLLLDNTDGDYVKVRDFGLSKLEKVEEEETKLTTQGTRVGNAEYMSPEYIKTSQYHMKGDLYALGALMYHMLTGAPPFTGAMMDVLGAHVDEEPAPPSTRAEVPEWLDQLVLDLLVKKPEQRPGAYRVVQRLQTGMGDQLDPPDLLPVDADGNVIRPSGPPTVAIALGVALLVITLLAVVGVGLLAVFAAIVALQL